MDNECYINARSVKTAYEWHLNDRNDSALRKAAKFRLQNEKLYVARHPLITFFLRLDAIIKDSVDALIKGYLNDIAEFKNSTYMEKIIEHFETASAMNDPVPVLRAYSHSQEFTERINKDMAKNTYHALTLYCTPLNCNVLARTQDGIQAFIAILFHPKLKDRLCKEPVTVYRGVMIDDEDLLKGYENGSTIITTTFLSTSRKPEVAEAFSSLNPNKEKQISLLCTYKIHNNYRRTALDMKRISTKPEEAEVLIYPYVPFRILSFTKRTLEPTGQKRIEVHLEEINDNENDNSDRQSVSTVSTKV